MSLASKLQIKPGQQVVVLRKPAALQLDVESSDEPGDAASAHAGLAFVTVAADLSTAEVEAVLGVARRDAVAWVAHPKGGRLGTDLNRDSLAALVSERGLRPVRQVSLDDTWSALRFRPAV